MVLEVDQLWMTWISQYKDVAAKPRCPNSLWIWRFSTDLFEAQGVAFASFLMFIHGRRFLCTAVHSMKWLWVFSTLAAGPQQMCAFTYEYTNSSWFWKTYCISAWKQLDCEACDIQAVPQQFIAWHPDFSCDSAVSFLLIPSRQRHGQKRIEHSHRADDKVVCTRIIASWWLRSKTPSHGFSSQIYWSAWILAIVPASRVLCRFPVVSYLRSNVCHQSKPTVSLLRGSVLMTSNMSVD